MVKNNITRLALTLVIAIIIPTYTALTLVDNAHSERIFGERISFLNHHPASFSKTPANNYLDEDNSQIVSRDFVANLPKNLEQLDVRSRKKQFIATILPLILRVNELILEDRAKIERLMSQDDFTQDDEAWLLQIAQEYRLEAKTTAHINFPKLLLRVDTIPPSLALAQAAIESGWGTSRFAQQANALYGQWTWSDNDSAGLVPLGREEGQRHRIKSFPYLIQSVSSYALNLNSHVAYTDLRKNRAINPNSINLTNSLIAYSTRREEYVNDLQSIIRVNRLTNLDQKILTPTL